MKTVKIELNNNNDLQDMFSDLMDDGSSMFEALEMVMDEVQLRTIMIEKYPKWAQHDTTIEVEGLKTVATVEMIKWKNL